ncbi:MAG: hypothetical protein M0C28_16125 [Candidatus Moduliflexus flocculans]|nr:hypothetical protein [Candidatus Moduliflexus flocculans]
MACDRSSRVLSGFPYNGRGVGQPLRVPRRPLENPASRGPPDGASLPCARRAARAPGRGGEEDLPLERRRHLRDVDATGRSSLGNVLLRSGALTREQFDESVEAARRGARRRGDPPARGGPRRHGSPDAGGARRVRVMRQVRDVLYSAFDWEEGSVSFRRRSLPDGRDHPAGDPDAGRRSSRA